jgi:hypothetical protein
MVWPSTYIHPIPQIEYDSYKKSKYEEMIKPLRNDSFVSSIIALGMHQIPLGNICFTVLFDLINKIACHTI